MLTYKDVQNSLASSNWDAQIQSELSAKLSGLGPEMLQFVDDQLKTTGGFLNAQVVLDVVSTQQHWYEMLTTGDSASVTSDLNKQLQGADGVVLSGLTALVSDLRNNKALSLNLDSNLSVVMTKLEVFMLLNVPWQNVVAMISERAGEMLPVADFTMELKRYCYFRSIEEPGDEKMIALRKGLESNTESFGEFTIEVKEKQEAATIQNYVKDFVDVGAATQDKSTFNVAYYLTNSPNVAKLSSQSKIWLSEILQFYVWSYQPYLTKKEIESYDATREQEYFSDINNADQTQEEIEHKLEELKERATHQV